MCVTLDRPSLTGWRRQCDIFYDRFEKFGFMVKVEWFNLAAPAAVLGGGFWRL
jgi:hypothetical protein